MGVTHGLVDRKTTLYVKKKKRKLNLESGALNSNLSSNL